MKLTRYFSRVALCKGDRELEDEEEDRSAKQRWTEGSPYAICNSTLPDDVSNEKFDRCVEDVKRKHKTGSVEDEEDFDRISAKKKYKAVNPWAVCHSQLGPEKDEKFERCVQDVKKTHKIKKD